MSRHDEEAHPAHGRIEMLSRLRARPLSPHWIGVHAIDPGAPDDVVSAVVSRAATPESRLVTGASVFIDGGPTIRST